MSSERNIRDPIHGFVTVEGRELDVLDTPLFQRLRRIHQLAMARLVYPGALHTRFDHTLGKLAETREHIKYDWLDEFVDDFAEKIAEFTETKEDAVEHITHLPELNDPEAFDHEDDSIYNDQNETEPPQH